MIEMQDIPKQKQKYQKKKINQLETIQSQYDQEKQHTTFQQLLGGNETMSNTQFNYLMDKTDQNKQDFELEEYQEKIQSSPKMQLNFEKKPRKQDKNQKQENTQKPTKPIPQKQLIRCQSISYTKTQNEFIHVKNNSLQNIPFDKDKMKHANIEKTVTKNQKIKAKFPQIKDFNLQVSQRLQYLSRRASIRLSRQISQNSVQFTTPIQSPEKMLANDDQNQPLNSNQKDTQNIYFREPNDQNNKPNQFIPIIHNKKHNRSNTISYLSPKIHEMYFKNKGTIPRKIKNKEKDVVVKKEEVKEEKEPESCLVCFDQPPDSVFLECGHGGVCYDCAIDVWKTTEECYLCRDIILLGDQTYIANRFENKKEQLLQSCCSYQNRIQLLKGQ